MTKNNLGRDGFVWLILSYCTPSTKGSRSIYSRQVRETGPEAETTEELCLHGLAPHGFVSMLSYTHQDCRPRTSTTYNRLSPPASISIKQMPHLFAAGQSYAGIFSVVVQPRQCPSLENKQIT